MIIYNHQRSETHEMRQAEAGGCKMRTKKWMDMFMVQLTHQRKEANALKQQKKEGTVTKSV